MKCFYIEHAENNGKFNMEFDLDIARKIAPDEFILRLYRWKPYAISLGANQSEKEIDVERAKKDLIDVVKRPTGGRAIFHAEELTYSFVVSAASGFSSHRLYNLISQALIKGLIRYNPIFKKLELEDLQPDFRKELKKISGAICFSSTAKHEVKFAGKKLIGSAQRKINNAILQHGSILIGESHKRLVDYLNVSEATKALMRKEMSEKTIELNSVLGGSVELARLYKAIKTGFEEEFNCSFVKTDFEKRFNFNKLAE